MPSMKQLFRFNAQQGIILCVQQGNEDGESSG